VRAAVVQRVAEHEQAADEADRECGRAPQPPAAAQLRQQRVRPRALAAAAAAAAAAAVQEVRVFHVVRGPARLRKFVSHSDLTQDLQVQARPLLDRAIALNFKASRSVVQTNKQGASKGATLCRRRCRLQHGGTAQHAPQRGRQVLQRLARFFILHEVGIRKLWSVTDAQTLATFLFVYS
jgi:hypothetical protein